MFAEYEFQLWLLWFRVLRFLRMSWRISIWQLKGVPQYLPFILECIKVIVVAPVWFMFESCVRAWAWMEHHAQAAYGYRVRGWQHLCFCLGLSLVVGHLLLFQTVGLGISQWSLLVFGGLGFVLCFRGQVVAQWSRHILGIRPDRPADPSRPFDGLKFGS